MTRQERIASYSTVQIFLAADAIGLGIMYMMDSTISLLSNPAYQRQQIYAEHVVFGAVLIAIALWSLARPRHASPQWRYQLLMTVAFSVYFLLAISFFPAGPTAVWTYLSLAALFLYEARR